MHPRTRTLKTYILFWLFLVNTAVMLLVASFFLSRSRKALSDSLDNTVLTLAEGLAMSTEEEKDGRIQVEFSDEMIGDFTGPISEAYFLIYNLQDGTEIARSKSLSEIDVSLPRDPESFPLRRPIFWNDFLTDSKVRWVALREWARPDTDPLARRTQEDTNLFPASFTETATSGDPSHGQCLFVTAVKTEQTDDQFRHILFLTTASFAIALGIVVLSGWFAVTKGLSPLFDLGQRVASLSPANMQPLDVPRVRELGALVETLNGAIGRVRDTLDREKRFSSDVAHELRTPVAEVRTTAEVALRHIAISEEEHRANYEGILNSCKRMQEIVEKLLYLTRCENGTIGCEMAMVPLRTLLVQSWDPFLEKLSERGIHLEIDVPETLTVWVDKDLLTIILANLVHNATEYTPSGGQIECRAVKDNSTVSFAMSNTSYDFASEDLDHIFDRFWRKDPSRTPGTSHTGLGLSLVLSFAQQMGFSVDTEVLDGFFTITLSGFEVAPCAPPKG